MAYAFRSAQRLLKTRSRPPGNPETQITGSLVQRLLSTGESGCPCNEARIQSKLHVESEDKFPLCVAEYQLVQAKWALCTAMAPITNISAERITAQSMENYNRYIELTLKLLGQFVRPVAKLMQHFGFDANGQKKPQLPATS